MGSRSLYSWVILGATVVRAAWSKFDLCPEKFKYPSSDSWTGSNAKFWSVLRKIFRRPIPLNSKLWNKRKFPKAKSLFVNGHGQVHLHFSYRFKYLYLYFKRGVEIYSYLQQIP
jgi:hypothetical protein